MKIGRGPATVIGCIAVSQATLPRRRGCGFFAREKRPDIAPDFSRGFFFVKLSRSVRGDSCTA